MRAVYCISRATALGTGSRTNGNHRGKLVLKSYPLISRDRYIYMRMTVNRFYAILCRDLVFHVDLDGYFSRPDVFAMYKNAYRTRTPYIATLTSSFRSCGATRKLRRRKLRDYKITIIIKNKNKKNRERKIIRFLNDE